VNSNSSDQLTAFRQSRVPNQICFFIFVLPIVANKDLHFDAHCCHMGTAIKHPVPDLVKPSFVFLTSGHSDAQVNGLIEQLSDSNCIVIHDKMQDNEYSEYSQ